VANGQSGKGGLLNTRPKAVRERRRPCDQRKVAALLFCRVFFFFYCSGAALIFVFFNFFLFADGDPENRQFIVWLIRVAPLLMGISGDVLWADGTVDIL